MTIKNPQHPRQRQSHKKGLLHLIIGALGIYISYILLGIVSQTLYSTSYRSTQLNPSDGTPTTHKFTHPSLIVWLSGLCCATLGYVKGMVTREPPNPTPTKDTLILGMLFAINMTASNFALLHIPYPTHALCSNSRYLVIVLIGTYFSRVPHKDDLKLPKNKLYVAIFITVGVVLFNLMRLVEGGSGARETVMEGEWKGYVLIGMSMVAQALFCDNQAYCKSRFTPSANHFFTSANFYSFLFTLIHSLLTSTLLPSLEFISTHPQCLLHILLLCLLQVTGQLSIYFIVTNFKQHIFPLISATRKVITVVCSIVVFGHHLSVWQWVCVGVVFAGMGVEVRGEINEKVRGRGKGEIIRSAGLLYQVNPEVVDLIDQVGETSQKVE